MKFAVLFGLIANALSQFHNPDENEQVQGMFLQEGDIRRNIFTRGSVKSNLWPNAVVPYKFSPYFAKYSSYVYAATEAMKVWQKVTCIKFVKRTTERDYLYFVIEKGCWSYVGKQYRAQKISLGSGCNWEGIAVHELGHALGFQHEQSRPDRDNYVTIKTANIKQGKQYNFEKHYFIDSLGTPYDYGSIMHYGPWAFSKNLKATIVAKKSGVSFGQRVGPSKIDIIQMRKLYKCPDTPYIDYGRGCSWRFIKAAYRCWRYCNPKSPKSGDWCWTNKSCASGGWMGLGKSKCPASISLANCAGRCS